LRAGHRMLDSRSCATKDSFDVRAGMQLVTIEGMTMGLQLPGPDPIRESPDRDNETIGGGADRQAFAQFLGEQHVRHDVLILANLLQSVR
jgi:hypothetical protein